MKGTLDERRCSKQQTGRACVHDTRLIYEEDVLWTDVMCCYDACVAGPELRHVICLPDDTF